MAEMKKSEKCLSDGSSCVMELHSKHCLNVPDKFTSHSSFLRNFRSWHYWHFRITSNGNQLKLVAKQMN